MPVHFCTKSTGSPPEKRNIICAMGYTLHCPKCKLTRSWCRTFHSCSPSTCPRLLFHNTKMRTYGTYFRQIFTPMTVIQVFRGLRISVQPKCKTWIGIICINIQAFLCHLVIIQIPEHTICGDIVSIFLIFRDYFCLHFTERNCTF